MLKQFGHNFRRNAYSSIGYRDLRHKAAIAVNHVDADRNAFCGILAIDDGVFSVGDQIYKDLQSLMLIDARGGALIECPVDSDAVSGQAVGV